MNATDLVEATVSPLDPKGRLTHPPRLRGWWVYAWRVIEDMPPTHPMPSRLANVGGELGAALATCRWP